MLVMVEVTYDVKDAREVVKRFSTWAGAPEGAKLVGGWADISRRKTWMLYDVTDVKDWSRSVFDWLDLARMEHHVVQTAEEVMAVAKEKGWW